jgi:hypothetical protein
MVFIVVYFPMLSVHIFNGRMSDEFCIGKSMEGSDEGVIEAFTRHLFGETEEIY